ncbi:uncharacterized protein LOC116420518 [Sarcophilus harrisii]|uniref:uncharacterized protein LOC116420518 n=1 Tax=Sarcophilus harrisii TaxID=9305 RepID=UPI001301F74B|nr:uncharacterized protein LOC116420518 [Sarcophilus harrisii]
MVKKSRAFSQDLAQEQQKCLLKKTKTLPFRDPPHRTVPSSNNKNVQEPDFEAKKDNIPARPKMEGKDAVASSSGRNLTFVGPPSPVPSIIEEEFPPVSPKRHSKATPACPGQADDDPWKRTSKVYSILDSAETGPEPSLELPQEESSASAQEFGPLWAIKVVGAPWKRTPKVCPGLPPQEASPSLRDFSLREDYQSIPGS